MLSRGTVSNSRPYLFLGSMVQENASQWTTEQIKYQEWLALPKALRTPKTQALLAKELGYDPATLWRWSQQPGFTDAVKQFAKHHLQSEVPAVLEALAKRAKGGDVPAMKLFLEMSGDYIQRTDMTSAGEKVGLIINLDGHSE